MSSSASPEGFQPLLISQTTFLGLVWGSTWVSFLFVFFRGYLRWKAFRKFFADDALVLLAWLLLFITAIIWQKRVYIIYYVWNISDGAIFPPPADIFEKVDLEVHQGLAVTILNFVSLWCIKFAFLLLFKKLGRNVKGQDILWWSVLLFTVATLAISIGVQAYGCVFGNIKEISVKCAQPKVGRYVRAILRVQAGVDIVSDAFIMLIPITLLWGVHINLRTKLELTGVFCLILFTMIVAIVKVVVTLRTPREDDSWLFAWSAIESAVAIIIACLVSYRASFRKEPPRKKYSGISAYPLRNTHNSASSKRLTENGTMIHGGKTSVSTLEGEQITSAPNAIHVRQEYEVNPAEV